MMSELLMHKTKEAGKKFPGVQIFFSKMEAQRKDRDWVLRRAATTNRDHSPFTHQRPFE
jgi:hypothetical protein